MFQALGHFTYRFRWSIIVVGIAFFLVGAVYGIGVFSSLKAGGFFDPNSESARVAKALHDHLNREEDPLVVLFTSKDNTKVDDASYKREVEDTLAKIDHQPGVGAIYTYYSTNLPQFVSKDHKSTYAAVDLSGDDNTQVRHVAQLRPLLTSQKLQVRLGGRPVVYQEMVDQVRIDLEKAELMTFPIVGILLLIIFRSVIASCLPLIIGGTAIIGAFLILRTVALFTDLSVFALNIITLLGFGLAIDYSLFMVSRYREELTRNQGDKAVALRKTMETAGHTILFSGLTVVICLLTLLVFPPMFLKSMGLGATTAVLIAMIAALTILPAILAVLGERVNMWQIPLPGRAKKAQPSTVDNVDSGFWYRISKVVVRHPIPVLILTLIPLLLLGSPLPRINFSIFDARSLPVTHESRAVDEVLSSQFPTNDTLPIQILVHTDGKVLDPNHLNSLYDYTRKLEDLPHVKRVDSLVTIDDKLDKAAYKNFYSDDSLIHNPVAATLANRFGKDNYTLVSVMYTSEPFSQETWDLVSRIRQLHAPPGFDIQVGGEPAYLYVDFLSTLRSHVPLAFGLIGVAMFVLLYLMLGSLVVPLKAIILNILSLSVSFGALIWVFQDGHLANILNFTPVGNIDSTMPVLIFTSAFGLSMDYEVFLLSRIKEYYDQTQDMHLAISRGLAKTGGIITSAALLLVVVIGSFTTGEVLFIKQIGVGLGLAIIVDATIVRTLLVPATLKLMGKYNWWAPKPLALLYQSIQQQPKQGRQPTETGILAQAIAANISPAAPGHALVSASPATMDVLEETMIKKPYALKVKVLAASSSPVLPTEQTEEQQNGGKNRLTLDYLASLDTMPLLFKIPMQKQTEHSEICVCGHQEDRHGARYCSNCGRPKRGDTGVTPSSSDPQNAPFSWK